MHQHETPPLKADSSSGTLVRLFDSSSTATDLTTQSSLERLGERVGRYRSKLSATIEQVNAHAEAVRARIGYYDQRLPPVSPDDPASASAGLHEVWGKLCDIYAALERTTVPPPASTPESLEQIFVESKTSPPSSESRLSVDSDRLSAFRSALSVVIDDEDKKSRSSSVDLPATVDDHLSVSQVALSGDSSAESIGPELKKLTESLTMLTRIHGSLHRLSSKTDVSLATAAASSCSAAKNSSGSSGMSDDRLSALESDLRECESDLERITASSRAAMDLLEANLRQISEAALLAIRGGSTAVLGDSTAVLADSTAVVTSQVAVSAVESDEKPLETTSSVNCTGSSSSVIESSVDHTSFGDDEYCCSERDDTLLSSSDQLSGSNIMAVTPLLAQRASSNHEKLETSTTTTPPAAATNQKSPFSALISTLSQITSTLSFICPHLEHPTLHSCSSSESFKTAELSLLSSAPGPPDARSDSVVATPLGETSASAVVADVDTRRSKDEESLLERLRSNRELVILPLAFFVLHSAITIINSHIKFKMSHRATISDIGLKPTFKLRI